MRTVGRIGIVIASLAGKASGRARLAYDVDSNLLFRNMQFHSNQSRAMRDPSKITFLLLPSADPLARYWITWDLTVVQFDATGTQLPISRCQFDPRFVDAHQPPPPRPTLEFDEVEYGHEAYDSTVALHVPTGIADPGAEFPPPLLPKFHDTRRCIETAAGARSRFASNADAARTIALPDSSGVRLGLGIGSVVSGILGAISVYLRDDTTKEYTSYCTKAPVLTPPPAPHSGSNE